MYECVAWFIALIVVALVLMYASIISINCIQPESDE